MMIEWEDHGEEEQQLLLRYLDPNKPRQQATDPKPRRSCRLIGRLYLAYLRWRYRIKTK